MVQKKTKNNHNNNKKNKQTENLQENKIHDIWDKNESPHLNQKTRLTVSCGVQVDISSLLKISTKLGINLYDRVKIQTFST